MPRKILITSGKGGVGKTSVCAFLGKTLSKMGERVVLIDLDFGLNNLDVALSVEDKVIYDIKDVIDGKCRVPQAVVRLSPTLSVIPSRHTFDKEITPKSIQSLIDGLSEKYDYIFLDCPAGIDHGFHRAASVADEAIVVVTPSMTSLRDGDKVLTLLKSYKLKSVSAVVNRSRGDLLLSSLEVSPSEIESVLKTPVIGCIPDDDSILLFNGKTSKNSRSYKSFKMLATYLKKGKGKIYDTTSFYRGFVGGIRRSLRSLV